MFRWRRERETLATMPSVMTGIYRVNTKTLLDFK